MWAVTLPRTADLAAQVYRTDLFARSGYVVWESARFAGHQLLGYSLTFPALASVGGLRPLGPLAAAMSVVCVDDLVARLRPDIERLPGARFAAAAVGDLSAAASRSRSISVALVALVAITRKDTETAPRCSEAGGVRPTRYSVHSSAAATAA